MSHHALVAALNQQWRMGRPAAALADAGVLVHVLDGSGIVTSGFLEVDDGLPPTGRTLWRMLGQPTVPRDSTHWPPGSRHVGDRAAGSIVAARYPRMYRPVNVPCLTRTGYTDLPFIVLNSTAARERLSCCYPQDAGTTKATCDAPGGDDSCVPGCYPARTDSSTHVPYASLMSCLRRMPAGKCPKQGKWCKCTPAVCGSNSG